MSTIRKCAGSSGVATCGAGSFATGSWEASLTYSPQTITHSGSNCHAVPVCGLKSWTASFSCYSCSKPCSAGDEVTFTGNSNTVGITGDCIVTSVSCNFDFNNCAPIVWNISVQGQGEASLTQGSGSGGNGGNGYICCASGGGSSLSTDTATFNYTESCEVSGGFATASSNCWAMYCVGSKSGSFSAQIQGYPPSINIGDTVGVSAGTEDCTVSGNYVITGISTSVDNGSADPITHTVTGVLKPN